MKLATQIKLEILAFLCSALGLYGLLAEQLFCLYLGILACMAILAASLSETAGDAIGFPILYVFLGGLGGLLLKLFAKMPFWLGVRATFCWALPVISAMVVIGHCFTARAARKKRSTGPKKQTAPKATEQPLTNEQLCKAYAQRAYELYRNAHLRLDYLRAAEQAARKALELGDKNMGLLLEDIEAMIYEVENDDAFLM